MIFQQKHLGDILAVTVSDTGISHRLANKQNQDAPYVKLRIPLKVFKRQLHL